MKSRCPHCGVAFDVTGKVSGTSAKCPKCKTEIKFPDGLREYKVLSQKSLCGNGRFDAEAIERKLNELSVQGWRVVGCSTVNVSEMSLAGSRNDAMIILERS